jgi:hypothetical protein
MLYSTSKKVTKQDLGEVVGTSPKPYLFSNLALLNFSQHSSHHFFIAFWEPYIKDGNIGSNVLIY